MVRQDFRFGPARRFGWRRRRRCGRGLLRGLGWRPSCWRSRGPLWSFSCGRCRWRSRGRSRDLGRGQRCRCSCGRLRGLGRRNFSSRRWRGLRGGSIPAGHDSGQRRGQHEAGQQVSHPQLLLDRICLTTSATASMGVRDASSACLPFISTTPFFRLRGLTTKRTGRPIRSASLNFTPAA